MSLSSSPVGIHRLPFGGGVGFGEVDRLVLRFAFFECCEPLSTLDEAFAVGFGVVVVVLVLIFVVVLGLVVLVVVEVVELAVTGVVIL